jgi:hypothetical protein
MLHETQQTFNVNSNHPSKTLTWRRCQENEKLKERGDTFLSTAGCLAALDCCRSILLQHRADWVEKYDLPLNNIPGLAPHRSAAPRKDHPRVLETLPGGSQAEPSLCMATRSHLDMNTPHGWSPCGSRPCLGTLQEAPEAAQIPTIFKIPVNKR